jgi:EpsI family protein
MIDRRGLLLGASCVGAAGLAQWLRPHKRFSLLGKAKMAAIVPTTFGAWTAQDDDGLVKPDTKGTLAGRLYNEILERIYANAESGAELMMLIAYGDTQSDLLQLHRPEICYPAVGFELLSTAPIAIPITHDITLPGRRVVARKGDRVENIVYWTRLGEYLPTGSGEQRKARLLTAMEGYVPDGGLFRFSVLGQDQAVAFAALDKFVGDLMAAVKPGDRRGMVGTALANQLAASTSRT